MRKLIFFSFFLFSLVAAQSQNNLAEITRQKFKLSENSIVKDSSGVEYPYAIWQRLLQTGDYALKPVNPQDDKTAFVIFKLPVEAKEKKLLAMSKPPESNFFRTGNSFDNFKTTDIDGRKINTKELKGKIKVINFWFIDCPPCRMEIPQLNELVNSYRNDDSVVFIGIALDQDYELHSFLKTNPFLYSIIDNGVYLAQQYNITAFPTNVVVDQEGKVYFHSSGYSINTAAWIRKSIEELKGKNK